MECNFQYPQTFEIIRNFGYVSATATAGLTKMDAMQHNKIGDPGTTSFRNFSKFLILTKRRRKTALNACPTLNIRGL